MLGTEFRVGGITIRSDGAPLFYYWGSTLGRGDVWVTGRPETDDAGVSVSTGFQLSRRPGDGSLSGAPIVRTTRSGDIRIAFAPSLSAGYAARYIEWNGDFSGQPIDTGIDGATTPGQVSYLMAFALDPQDRPGIAYRNGSNVYFATNLGTGWQSEIAWSTTAAAQLDRPQAAFTFDAAGAPVLFLNPGDNLNVLTRTAPGWTSAPLDPVDSIGWDPIAARDGLDQIELIFRGLGSPRRAVGTPGAWDTRGSVPMEARTPSVMALGSAGEIHAPYGNGPLLYAYYDNCRWSTQTISDSGTVVGIALDAGARPHIAYEKEMTQGMNITHELWYAYPTPVN